ncbi:MAG TPA: PAS domain-containing protein [Cyclobacteriaceae bacterium]|nr:PAS domain-containing protein [Cyclobacteriaceae bacterium]
MGKLPEFIDFQHSDSIIISETDPHGTIIHANDNFCDISGYALGELVGKPHNIIRHPTMPKELFRHLWTTIKEGGVFRGIIRNRKRDGSHYWVNATIMPVYHGDQIARYIGGRHFISDEKLAEELFRNQATKFGWGDF